MTEYEARQVLLLQAHETGGPNVAWSAEDRAWATRQAAATVGERAPPERFVVARAVMAMQRLLPRVPSAQRWLARRGWHPAWVLLAALVGAAVGLAADQLGPPQRVNLLAPAVWAVVGWNVLVYLALCMPRPAPGRRRMPWRFGFGITGRDVPGADVGALWSRHATGLQLERWALVLHTAAALLALGLIAGLYLRGLVLDYRAGWQSTFLDAPAVQAGLDALLAPASFATGIAVQDVAPLRVASGGVATATAAPWIHLYAATLALFVLLPRAVLAALAGWRARRLGRRFPLLLDTPYFEDLHPLMRPGLPRAVRLLWVSSVPIVHLLGQRIGALDAPLTLLQSDEGDELHLQPVPPQAQSPSRDLVPVPAPTPRGWWARWFDSGDAPEPWLPTLRAQTDAVLLVTTPDAARPPWLASLGCSVTVLLDVPAGTPVEAPMLGLHALADGWLPDGRLLTALGTALPGDPRMRRLAAAWQGRQQQRFDGAVAEMAHTLGVVASDREAVADDGVLGARRADADAARQRLVERLDAELLAHALRLATSIGQPPPADDADHAVPAATAALRQRVGEGRVALVGGVLSGALVGLKADLLSGGLTMGAGALAGGLIGALGAAGAARGLNVVRGTDRSFVVWNEEALLPVTEALLMRFMLLEHAIAAADAQLKLAPALAAHRAMLATLWRTRQARFDNAGDADKLGQSLREPLGAVLRDALGPAPADRTAGAETPAVPASG